MFIIRHRKIFFGISALLIVLSIISTVIFGLNLGIDFTGGSILEIKYDGERPELSTVRDMFDELNIESGIVQTTGESGLILRMRDLTETEKESLDQGLTFGETKSFTEERFSSIGPTIGSELARKGLIAIALVVILIILFIAYVFRGVSRPVSSWKYGIVAIITLAHDIIIPIGLASILGKHLSFEVDALFLTALLAILGLSVNDTIVIFDRIRENLRAKISPHFEEVVGISLRQSIARSINTSLTTVVVLLALLFWGGQTTQFFALTLVVGMTVGTYSSIFLAAPLLVALSKGKAITD